MSLRSLFSSVSRKPGREPQPTSAHPQCRYILDSNLRCRRQPSVAGSGLCLHHENQILALRRDQSEALTTEIYGPVKTLDSAVAINHILSNLFRLTLEDRIPQTKARLLTSMCRTLLKSVEAARHEITTAKLFPASNRALLALLSTLPGAPATVIPRQSDQGLQRDLEVTAPFPSAHSDARESRPTVVVAGLACPETIRGARPGVGETRRTEKPAQPDDVISCETAAPQSSLQRDRASDRTCAATSTPQNSTTQPHSIPARVAARFTSPGFAEAETQNAPTDSNRVTAACNTKPPSPNQTPSPEPEPAPDDHVIWLGPRPFLPNKK